MAALIIEGIYKDGRVELTGRPPEIAGEARVMVTFFPAEDAQEREALRQQAFAQMEKGIPLGGPPDSSRDESSDEARREAIDRLMSRLEAGIDFGGPPYPKREALYDRVYKFDRRDG